MTPTALSRRVLLRSAVGAGAGLVVAGVSGCGEGPARATAPAVAVAPGVDRDDLTRARRAATQCAGLVAGLGSATRRHGELRTLLRPIAERHREQVAAFTPEGETARAPDEATVPASPTAVLRVLVRAERRAADAIRAAALTAGSGDLAAALAAAGAAMAQNVALLTAALAERGGDR